MLYSLSRVFLPVFSIVLGGGGYIQGTEIQVCISWQEFNACLSQSQEYFMSAKGENRGGWEEAGIYFLFTQGLDDGPVRPSACRIHDHGHCHCP